MQTPQISVTPKQFHNITKARTVAVPGDFPAETPVILAEVDAANAPTGRTAAARVLGPGPGLAHSSITGHANTRATHRSEITRTVRITLV